MGKGMTKIKVFLKFVSFSSFSTIFFFILQLSKIAFSINFFKLIYYLNFYLKIKIIFFSIKECLNISAYPQIISLLGKLLNNFDIRYY